jgi:signal transduction histidine kinase
MSLAGKPGSGAGIEQPRPTLFTYTTQQGLFSDEIFEILQDDEGWLWMSCSRGVFRVRKQELYDLDEGRRTTATSIAYGKADGLESIQCSGIAKPAGWKSRDGRLWFATSKGVIAVDPKTTKVSHVPPPVFIEELLADRKPFECLNSLAGAVDAVPSLGDLGSGMLRLPPGRGELEFHYTALNLQAPESCLFRYKLEGVDSEWVEAGTRRTAHYNNVYPGHYRFRVSACNKEGVWNESGDVLAFELRPHFWQTWWWRGAVALVVVGGASGSARYLTWKRMQRRLELMEQRHAIEKERGRIAKDIHDDLGSSLTRIMMLGERAEDGLSNREDVSTHVRKIVTSARNTVQALDEIVWAVNPENDTLEGLVEYISHYADEFFENTNVSCRLEMPVQLPALSLSAEARHDLFLAVKEAFNNILKHSQASSVCVQVASTDSTVAVLIEDNGCGFNPGKLPGGRKGNGLMNMRKRIEGLGGHFEMTTVPAHGTKLTFSVRLQPPQTAPESASRRFP